MPERSEQRGAIRMNVDRMLSFRLADTLREFSGVCKNLSGSGIAFVTSQAVEPGSVLAIMVEPGDDVLVGQSMNALVEVVRCQSVAARLFEVSGQIKGVRSS